MLRSDLWDFSDVYLFAEGRVSASFNPRRINYVSNEFPNALFPDNYFPEGSIDQEKTTARNAAKSNAVNTANAAGDRTNLIKCISFRSNSLFINCLLKINATLMTMQKI